MISIRWALPLFKGFKTTPIQTAQNHLLFKVPKTTQAAAHTDIAYASCEICSYHLEFESLDLLPPF